MPLVVVMPAYANQTSIDLWQSFPDNQGDNGFFAYGYAPATNTNWLLSDAGSYSFNRPQEVRWHNPNIRRSTNPWIFFNPSGTASNAGSPENAVLAQVAQEEGFYQINGSFYIDGASCNGIDAYIKRNSLTLWASYLPPGATINFDVVNLFFNVGDTIYFGVDAHSGSFSECNDWAYLNGQIQMVSVFGETLKLSPSYEFSVEQSAQKTDSIQIFNSGTITRTASLEVINPYSDLTVSLTEPNPVSIAPGETKTLPINLNASATPAGVYDDLLLKITVDDGSTLYSSIKVNVVPSGTGQLPDLTLTADDISSVINADGTVTLTANVCNRGNSPASNVAVQFQNFDIQVDETVIPLVPAKGCTTTSIIVPSSSSGDRLFKVVIDPSGVIPELDKDNNEANRIVRREDSSGETAGKILVISDMPSTVCSNSLFAITGQAVYDITVNGVRDMGYVVKGGSVQITADWPGYYGDIHTDVNGNFERFLLAPESIGIHSVTMTVTDNTFNGTGKFVFEVVPCSGPDGQWVPLEGGYDYCGENPQPDPEYCINVIDATLRLWELICPSGNCKSIPEKDIFVYSEDVAFSNNHPTRDEEITVGAQIHYSAISSDRPSGKVTVNFHITAPGSSGMELPPKVIDSIPAASSRSAFTNWKAPADGIYIVEVEAVPTEITENARNNAATRAIVVGQYTSGQGAASGQVRDSSGGVGGVPVHLFGTNGTLGSTVTDTTGFYLIEHVPVGNFQVRVIVPAGYANAEAKPVNVADQSVSAVDFQLTKQAADTTPPVLNLPPAMTAEATSASGAAVTYTVSATDDVDGAVTPTCTPASGSVIGLGNTTVTCTATDQAGNTASGSFTITVVDTTAPIITVPGNLTAEATGPSGATVTFNVSATDLVSSGITPTCAPASGSAFALGATPVNCSATDQAGNTANGSFTVTVVDTTPPTLTVPDDLTAEATSSSGATVTFTASATDAVNGAITPTCTPASGSTFPVGATTVHCTAIDQAGNSANGGFIVTVRDTTPPVLSLPADITVVATGPTGAAVTFTASATDTVSGALTPTCAPASGSTFPVGATTVHCSATDRANNTASGSFTVTVVSAPPPPGASTFSAFSVNQLNINQRFKTLFLLSNFTLGQDSNGINPVTEPVTLAIATFTTTIPAGSFRQGSGPVGAYAFAGRIDNVAIEVLIAPLGNNRFGLQAAAYGANLSGTTNPVTVILTIGNDSGTTSINNAIIR